MTAHFQEQHAHRSPDAPRSKRPRLSPGDDKGSSSGHQTSPEDHSGHGWLMIACCIPMLLVVAALVVSGVAGIGAILFAAACLSMMWLMMRAMPRDHH